MCLKNNNNLTDVNNSEEDIKIVDEDDEVENIINKKIILSSSSLALKQNNNNNKTPKKHDSTTFSNGISTPKSQIISPTSSSTSSKQKSIAKIYDHDKHCGVSLNGSKPCMRSLTCKKHSVNLRRQVEGRSKSFNDLFKQFRDVKIRQNQEQSIVETPKIVVDLNKEDEEVEEQKQDSYSYNNNVYPQPIAVCTYGARYLDNESNYLVWNHKQDNFRSLLSSTFNDYLTKQNSTPEETIVKPRLKTVKPILITLPSSTPINDEQKLTLKRSNSLTKVKTKSLDEVLSPKPTIITSPKIQLPPTPTKSFVLPSNIKLIQAVPTQITKMPIVTTTTNGARRTLITSKKPQTIVPKSPVITTTSSNQQPIITKTTKISPKTSEYIILNGNCVNKSAPTLNGINKLTVISTPNSTTPTKSINLIQTPSIQLSKRCIDNVSTSPSTDNYTFSSPKYIKLSHNTSNGVVTTQQNGINNNSPSTLILTPIAGQSSSSSSNSTVLKSPISKLKIPITTNIRNK